MRARPLSPTLALALALAAGASAEPERVWVEVSAPAPAAAEFSPVALLELVGRAGVGPAGALQVILALDVSHSSLRPAGADIDGDGRVGRRLRSADDPLRSWNPRRVNTDPGDSVLAAEVAGARRLVERLAPSGAELGLLVFAERAELRAPLGSSRAELEAALDGLTEEPSTVGGGTDLGAAVRTAHQVYRQAGDETARRILILLSDGTPEGRGRDRDEATRAAAEALAREGVRIHALALGADAMEGSQVYREIAELGGGEFVRVAAPTDLPLELERLDLARVAQVQVENLSAGLEGRAVRLFADGSFDAVVPLVEGRNQLRVTVHSRSGRRAVTEREVRFERREPATPEEARLAAERLERLRLRTVETELSLDVARRREAEQRRELDLDREEPPGVPATP